MDVPIANSFLARQQGADKVRRLSKSTALAKMNESFQGSCIPKYIACYVMVAVMWLLPDPRIEKAIVQ
jgi:hypothetical protein